MTRETGLPIKVVKLFEGFAVSLSEVRRILPLFSIREGCAARLIGEARRQDGHSGRPFWKILEPFWILDFQSCSGLTGRARELARVLSRYNEQPVLKDRLIAAFEEAARLQFEPPPFPHKINK